jgi:hypothetical protein
MMTCVATYMDHFPHIADDPVSDALLRINRKSFRRIFCIKLCSAQTLKKNNLFFNYNYFD